MKKPIFSKLTRSQIFNNKTRIKHKRNTSDHKKLPEEWTTIYYKGYPRFKKIKLPRILSIKKRTLVEALRKRVSTRDFSSRKITLKELSTILYYSFGISTLKKRIRRFYPSAGGRYPLEIYIIVLNVKGLHRGIYHYHLRSNSLEFLWNYNDLDNKIKNIFVQDWLVSSSFIISVSAVFWRTEMKYGDRGYRHVLIEAGHASQNAYLVCASMNLGCCSIAGFTDNLLNELLDLDGDEESVIANISAGRIND